VRIIQDRRKEIDCEYTDRIEIGVVTESSELRQALEKFIDFIKAETLAVKLVFEPLPGVEPVEAKLGEWSLKVFLRVVR
jgi:isoleucyl-tRNA synthetase